MTPEGGGESAKQAFPELGLHKKKREKEQQSTAGNKAAGVTLKPPEEWTRAWASDEDGYPLPKEEELANWTAPCAVSLANFSPTVVAELTAQAAGEKDDEGA